MDEDSIRAAELRQSLLDSSDRSDWEDSERVKVKRRVHSKRVKRPNSAWFIFDNLSSQQAEDLLRQHGSHASYLVSHFHDPQSYQLIIRFDEDEGLVFKHYAIGISNNEVYVEGITGRFKSIEDCVMAIEENLCVKLTPIFHQFNCETCDYSLTISEEAPPDYTPAQKYPEAPKKKLPLIVPIRPTLRRLQQAANTDSFQGANTFDSSNEDADHGCFWRACHTDPGGHWYKPHKAGPCMAVFLVVGWMFFLLIFGWIVLLALILVGILVLCAYVLNFICTGRCSIDDDDDDD